jgi:hypothetical protein
MVGGTMTTQRIHSQLAPLDILTREEMEQVLNKSMDAMIRERYRGIDIVRIPFVPITATAATVQLFTSNDSTPWGPEQGDVWVPMRVIVKSSVLTDTAKYVIYRGSTPSDVQNAYTSRYLLDAMAAAGVGLPVNQAFYIPRKSTFLQPGEQIYAQVFGATIGNQYMLDSDAIRCPAEMKGKII